MTAAIDTYLFLLINQGMANALFDFLMPLLSDRGFLLALPPLVFASTLGIRRSAQRRNALLTGLIVFAAPIAAFFLADLLNDIGKVMIARPRPCHTLETVRLLAHCPRSFSMPSGHAIASFAFAVSFVILTRDGVSLLWRWYILMLAAIIAFSRVYIGVHYPSDIAVGTLLGVGLAWLITVPVLRFREHLSGPIRKHDGA